MTIQAHSNPLNKLTTKKVTGIVNEVCLMFGFFSIDLSTLSPNANKPEIKKSHISILRSMCKYRVSISIR